MTDLMKLMRGMTMNMLNANMMGSMKVAEMLNAMSGAPEPNCCSIMPPKPASSIMDVLYPLWWLKLASGLLGQVEKAMPAGHVPAPGQAMSSVLDSAPPPPALPPAASTPPGTGWGPMP